MGDLRYEIRPLGEWLQPKTDPRRGAHLFRVGWDKVLDELGYELDLLNARRVVLQVDVTETELRRDGMLRTDAKVGFPGVRVSFESIHGPLTYSTDAYERWYGYGLQSWQANVRAIGLALTALRAVDRYGVSGRGEQYRGWTAIERTPHRMDRTAAAKTIAEGAGLDKDGHELLLRMPSTVEPAYREAAKRWHPDRPGGDAEIMARLNEARTVLLGGAS